MLEDRFSLEGILPDRPEIWSAYPYKQDPIVFHANMLLQERFKLVDLTWTLGSTLFRTENVQSCSASHTAVEMLAHSFLDWYSALPETLRGSRDMPAPLYELQYVCFVP